MLHGTSDLILGRTAFGMIEHLQGNSGYLISKEFSLCYFDALLMDVVMSIFLV